MVMIMARSQKSRIGSCGYTLIELLVVLAIMGLMVALAPPMLESARTGMQARLTMFRLAARLESAHEKAIDTQTIVQMPLASGRTVLFFPDGSATGAIIHEGGFIVSVLPLSGRISINE